MFKDMVHKFTGSVCMSIPKACCDSLKCWVCHFFRGWPICLLPRRW